ncbi:MAG: hypothetical protein IPF99_27085 [Deltaproteobacteria bacterium]|nr:hypothetical protein [Deltaproteobacteria bacterium]
MSDGAYCRWSRPTGAPMRGYADVTNTFDGRTMVALGGPTGDDALVLSSDGGRSWTTGARLMGYFSETADVAPNDPMRVYVTAYASGGIPVLLRSDDGGRTVREVTRNFSDAQGIYLAGVDARRPDVLYVRATRGLGTMLLKSEDGGMTLRSIGETRAEMVGFALSDDGDTVWIASTSRAEGIRRSVRGGPFTRVGGDVGVKCLRYHAGLLFVCADEVTDGYALGCSRDGGEHIDPLLSLRRLTGSPAACGGDTPVGSTCGPIWPTVSAPLRSIDASAPATRCSTTRAPSTRSRTRRRCPRRGDDGRRRGRRGRCPRDAERPRAGRRPRGGSRPRCALDRRPSLDAGRDASVVDAGPAPPLLATAATAASRRARRPVQAPGPC